MVRSLTSRRQFISGATMAAATTAMPLRAPWAASDPGARIVDVVTRVIDVKGKAATVYGLMGPNGKHGLEFTAGESFYVRLNNKLPEPTIIHWHGLTPPSHQDGVPVLSHDPVGPLTSQLFDFRLTEPGTHWMHSHFNLTQFQRLMASPLIVRNPADRGLDEQEVVLMLSDFTFRDPEEVLAGLKSTSHAVQTASGSHHMAAGEDEAKVGAAMTGTTGMSGMAGMSGMSGTANAPATSGMAGMSGMSATPSAPATSGMAGMSGMHGGAAGAAAPAPPAAPATGTAATGHSAMAGMSGMAGMTGMTGMAGMTPAAPPAAPSATPPATPSSIPAPPAK